MTVGPLNISRGGGRLLHCSSLLNTELFLWSFLWKWWYLGNTLGNMALRVTAVSLERDWTFSVAAEFLGSGGDKPREMASLGLSHRESLLAVGC